MQNVIATTSWPDGYKNPACSCQSSFVFATKLFVCMVWCVEQVRKNGWGDSQEVVAGLLIIQAELLHQLMIMSHGYSSLGQFFTQQVLAFLLLLSCSTISLYSCSASHKNYMKPTFNMLSAAKLSMVLGTNLWKSWSGTGVQSQKSRDKMMNQWGNSRYLYRNLYDHTAGGVDLVRTAWERQKHTPNE